MVLTHTHTRTHTHTYTHIYTHTHTHARTRAPRSSGAFLEETLWARVQSGAKDQKSPHVFDGKRNVTKDLGCDITVSEPVAPAVTTIVG